jgi:hypothetical protein
MNTLWRLKTVSVRVSVSAVFYAFHLKNEASVNVCEVLLFTCARYLRVGVKRECERTG